MTQEYLIIQLRNRLNHVSADITRLQNVKRPDNRQFLIDAGRIDALMIEQQFLADLIGRLEQEEVQP